MSTIKQILNKYLMIYFMSNSELINNDILNIHFIIYY